MVSFRLTLIFLVLIINLIDCRANQVTRDIRHKQELEKDLNDAHQLVYSLCPSLIAYPTYQDRCFDQWTKLNNLEGELKITNTSYGLGMIQDYFSGIVKVIKDITNNVDDASMVFTSGDSCQAHHDTLAHRCKEVLDDLVDLYELGNDTCSGLVQRPALQKVCMQQMKMAYNIRNQIRTFTDHAGFDIISDNVRMIIMELNQIKKDLNWIETFNW